MCRAGKDSKFAQRLKHICALGLLVGLSSTTAVAADTATVPIVGPEGIIKSEPVQRYGPVSGSDTLWRVASKLRPSKSVSVYQTMMALYLKNPEAFENGNINRLMRNSLLIVPSLAEISAVTDAQAKAKLAADKSSSVKATPKKQITKQAEPPAKAVTPAVTQPVADKPVSAPEPSVPEPVKPQTPPSAIQATPTAADSARMASLRSELEDSIASLEEVLEANTRMDQQLRQLERTVAELQVQLQEQLRSNQVVTEGLKLQVESNTQDIEESDSTSSLAFYVASGIGGLVLIVTGLVIWLMMKSRKLSAQPAEAAVSQEAKIEAPVAAPVEPQPEPEPDTSDADALAALDELSADEPAAEPGHESLDLDNVLEEDSSLLDLDDSLDEDVIHLDDLDLGDSDDVELSVDSGAEPESTADDELIAQNDLPHDEGELDIDALLNETADAQDADVAEEPAAEQPIDPDSILSNADLDALLNEDADSEPELTPMEEPVLEPEPAPGIDAAETELAEAEDELALDAIDIAPDSDPLAELEAEPSEEPAAEQPEIELPVEDEAAAQEAELPDAESQLDEIDLGVDFDSLLNEPDSDQISNDGLESSISADEDANYIDIDQLLQEAETAEPGVDEFPGLEPPSNGVPEEEEDGIAAKLDLARAYIEIGDFSVASDLLKEILQDGSDEQQAEANELLGRIDS